MTPAAKKAAAKKPAAKKKVVAKKPVKKAAGASYRAGYTAGELKMAFMGHFLVTVTAYVGDGGRERKLGTFLGMGNSAGTFVSACDDHHRQGGCGGGGQVGYGTGDSAEGSACLLRAFAASGSFERKALVAPLRCHHDGRWGRR